MSAIQGLIPVRDTDAYKNLFGHVLIIAGNEAMGGAAQMAALATVHSGAGLTSIATDKVNLPAIHTVLPEAMIMDWTDLAALKQLMEKVDVVLIGPGFGMDNVALWHTVKECLAQSQKSLKIILDADALNLLSQDLTAETTIAKLLSPENQHTIVLTPHLGEWRRLTAGKRAIDDKADIQNWVNAQSIHLVLKGARTELYFPNEQVFWRNNAGNPGMAIGGMGDTLGGMIAGLSGQLSDISDAIKVGVYLHSYIADQLYQTQYVVLPSQISANIPRTMKEISKSNKKV